MSFRIDATIADRVRRASESWAKREGLPADGQMSQWVTKQLNLAAKVELKE